MINPLIAVRQFMTFGGQATNTFDQKQYCLYVGLQLEELSEKIEVIQAGTIDYKAMRELADLATTLRSWSKRFKQHLHVGDIMRSDYEKLLDADIDLAWVAIGAAYSISNDAAGAFAEVSRANHDKFPDGVALRDSSGKVRKPEGWRPPDLSPFVAQISD